MVLIESVLLCVEGKKINFVKKKKEEKRKERKRDKDDKKLTWQSLFPSFVT